MTKYIKIVANKEDQGQNGTFYYKDKKMTILHREDGPAMVTELDRGTEVWYKDGKLHREDGPALIYGNGEAYHYLNDVYVSPTEFKRRIDPVMELTLEDIAKLAGVSVEKIKIVKQKS
jgi:hypothetical protein